MSGLRAYKEHAKGMERSLRKGYQRTAPLTPAERKRLRKGPAHQASQAIADKR